MKIAFDIDDTLIIPSVARGFGDNTPNYETIAIYKWFQAQGNEMILWSGSGVGWAQRWGEKLGLEPFTVRVKEKADDIDICFDDMGEVNLAKVNVKVKRINNSISRAEWNKTKKPSHDAEGSQVGWQYHKETCRIWLCNPRKDHEDTICDCKCNCK